MPNGLRRGIEVEGDSEGILSIRSIRHSGSETYLSQCHSCSTAVVGDSVEGVSIWFGLHVMEHDSFLSDIAPVPVRLPVTWVTQSWFEMPEFNRT